MVNQLGGKKEVKVVNWRKMHQVKKNGTYNNIKWTWFLELFYHFATVSNLNQILEEIHIYSESDVIERKITNKELDIPTKPFVFNNRFIIDLNNYISMGTKLKYISILPKLISNTTLEIILIDKVKF